METLQLNMTMDQNSTLLTIMSILNQIRDRNLDHIFDSLRDVINLLQQYNVELDDSIGIRVGGICSVKKPMRKNEPTKLNPKNVRNPFWKWEHARPCGVLEFQGTTYLHNPKSPASGKIIKSSEIC